MTEWMGSSEQLYWSCTMIFNCSEYVTQCETPAMWILWKLRHRKPFCSSYPRICLEWYIVILYAVVIHMWWSTKEHKHTWANWMCISIIGRVFRSFIPPLTSVAVVTSITRPAFSVPKAVRTSHARPVFLDRKGVEERRGGWMYPISTAESGSLRRTTGDLLGLSISHGPCHPWFQPPTDQASSRGSNQWHVCFILRLSKFV